MSHPHGAENVVLGETLAVDINHQNLNLIPAPLLQLLELLDACLHGLPTHRTAGDADGFRHFRQHLVVFAGRDSTHQSAEHVLAQGLVLPQRFISWDLHFALGLVPQPWSLHAHLPVGELNATHLRTVMANLAAGSARGTGPGHFFRAQSQNDFQSLHPNFMDDGVHYLARALDHVHDREQDLAIGSTELLDDRGRLLGGARDDLIRFTQGGWLLSDSRFSSTGF